MTEINEQLVKANSKTDKYSYASLSDIAKQNKRIPKMKTGTDPISLKDYVYYFDEELKEWIRGAEIVVPEAVLNSQGKAISNEAMRYGSGLTYARRYSTYLALSLASDDDKSLEGVEGEQKKSVNITQAQGNYLLKLYSPQEIKDIMTANKIDRLGDLSKDIGSQLIKARANGEVKAN